MWLGPNPCRVDQPRSFLLGIGPQATHIGQAQGHELATFQLTGYPFAAILALMPPLASSALMEGCLRADPFGDVGRASQARSARVDAIWHNRDATQATQDVRQSRIWNHWSRRECSGIHDEETAASCGLESLLYCPTRLLSPQALSNVDFPGRVPSHFFETCIMGACRCDEAGWLANFG